MSTLNFPDTRPNGDPLQPGDTYLADTGVTYTYDGVKWIGRSNVVTAIGYTGSQGVQGTIGYTGSQGIQGPIGYTGSQGIQGIEGVQGPTGLKGDQGLIGNTGTQGIQGIEGPQGLTGPKGDQGPIGNTGTQGIQGIEGPQGLTGPKGDQGPIGNTGTQGIQGSTGTQGIEGPIGLTGDQGIQGSTGTQGPRGFTGDQGVSVTLVGSTSTVGGLPLTGNAGDGWIVNDNGDLWFWSTINAQWEDIGQIVGPQGDPGADGPQGTQGLIGNTGTQGPQGSIGLEGPQGPIGPEGPQGPIGNTGTQGIQGLEGPQGPIGPEGPQGLIGNTGTQGIQGIEGLQGPIGPEGPQGLIGNTGTQGIQGIQGETGSSSPLDRITTGSYSVVVGEDGVVSMVTSRGTVLFGALPELIGAASHFHIMKDDPTTVDLFFGDDYNYVKLPYVSTLTNVGVEIATEGNHTWSFGKDGNTTMPGQAAQPYRLLASQYSYNTSTTTVVIFTGTPPAEATKATIHVKGALTVGDTSTTYHQICEMLIARKDTYDANTAINTTLVEAMVYGVTHTSVVPIATFDAQYNATTMCFEITMDRDPAYTGVNAKVIATESVNLD